MMRRTPVKTFICSSVAVILFAVSATAQDTSSTIQPNELIYSAKHKPALQLSEQQRREIQEALVTAHSAQKTPDKWEAKVGAKIPIKLKLDAMPAALINQEPVLKQYDFVKLDSNLLVCQRRRDHASARRREYASMIVVKRPPNWGPFRKASGFGGVIRGRV
jgi:hypothetical protein